MSAAKRGGAREGAGRPPVAPEERRGVVVTLRLTAAEAEALDAARGSAERVTWAREAVLARARRAARRVG